MTKAPLLLLSRPWLLLATLWVRESLGWVPVAQKCHHHHHRRPSPPSTTTTIATTTTAMPMNILSDLGDALTGGALVAQTGTLPYGAPLGGSTFDSLKTLAVQERALSFTGEDFDVFDVDVDDNNRQTSNYCRVRGAMLHLPGKDKMRLIDTATNQVQATLDRKLVALTPTYDVYRGDGTEKIGWLEKATIALTDTFEFHVENAGGFGPFKPPAAYKLEGDFLDRRFVMKNDKGQAVAKITQDQIVEFDQFNHYQIRIAPNMDAMLVVACCCVIDEEFDEEHQKQREEKAKRNQ